MNMLSTPSEEVKNELTLNIINENTIPKYDLGIKKDDKKKGLKK